jgi:adenine phosphoribosyltransferase
MKGRGPRPRTNAQEEFARRLRDSFRWVGSYADVTGWWRDPELVAGIGPALAELAGDTRPDVVLAPQSRGTLAGALVAHSLGTGLIELRKEVSRLADNDGWLVARTPPDYRDRNLELGIRADLLAPGTRVLFVDDWVDTGGQLQAAHTITEVAHAHWCGTAVIVDALADPRLRRDLNVRSLVRVRDL